MTTIIGPDRKNAPVSHHLENISLLKPELLKLKNGIPVYYISGGTEDVVRVEFLFNAGNIKEDKPLIANAVNNLLTAGTLNRHSQQIVEEIDYYGAFFQNEINFDKATISLYTLNKYLLPTLTVVKDVLVNSVFPEKEIKTFFENTKQRMFINLQKNDYIARREFNRSVFGSTHPYGRLADPEDCDLVNREELLAFYKNYYSFSNCTILISGKVTNEVLSIITKLFEDISIENKSLPEKAFSIQSAENKKIAVERPEALQSAIRIGKVLVNKMHPDYHALQILNTVLGGYFGSRLMANIREDKGYTYGIGSGLASLQQAGYFYIATEVGANVTTSAIDEIYKEIRRLQSELVPKDELELVKNYLLGSFLGSIENIFSYAEKFKSIYNYNLGYDYYENYFYAIKTVNSERLLTLAQQYFNIEEMVEVVVGKK
jgi:zinc protease